MLLMTKFCLSMMNSWSGSSVLYSNRSLASVSLGIANGIADNSLHVYDTTLINTLPMNDFNKVSSEMGDMDVLTHINSDFGHL